MGHLELLAPARNADIGIAAIDCGADAVYIAGPEFGARQDAGNSMEDVRRLCSYAHKFGVRIFLTLNTILYDDELPEAERLLVEAADAGVDAVIAQDLAVFEILHRHGRPDRPSPAMEIHASTQCAIRTPDQARFYESLGASRLVLERQLSLEQIRAIREAVDCELECFVHGALCVCYSGQCYMSESVAGRSANRGACVQACRSLYDLADRSGRTLVKNKALLSLKDLNLLERLPELAEAGVDSFKIEGRLKNISYVRNVVLAYSKALDELVAKNPDKYSRVSFGRVTGGFVPDLGKTFNRGYTDLFIDGRRGRWSSMDAPKSVGEEIGTVVRIVPSGMGTRKAPHLAAKPVGVPAMMQVFLDFDNPATALHNGDGFSFVSKDRNEIIGFRGDMCRGAMINSRYVPELFVGARLRRNLSAAFEKEMEATLPERLINVKVFLNVTASEAPASAATSSLRFAPYPGKCSPVAALPVAGYSIKVKAESEDGRNVEFEVEAGNQPASNRERMEAMFASQIGKVSGIYLFSLSSLKVETPDGSLPFMSASALNGIRREVAERLESMECSRVPMRGDGRSKPAMTGKTVSYKANISNKVAREVLRELGAESIEDAYEVSHRKEAELMRSKYCIRHELGMCLKDPSSGRNGTTPDLYLFNNGRRYRLGFDCSRCEMTVSV